MLRLIKFLNVSLYGDQEFGIRDVNFELQKHRKYHLLLPDTDQLKTLLGLLEGRYHPQAGIVHRYGNAFLQSDRLLLGDKVYSQIAGNFLQLKDEQFYFEDRKRSKQTFLHDLNARHIRHYPIYKLRGEDRTKFALLAMTFQESGIILISELLIRKLPGQLTQHLKRIIRGTRCAVCLLTVTGERVEWLEALLEETQATKIDLSQSA